MKTYYDVLNLGRNCSAKEIKDSFLKLSKIYHPDVNKHANAHSKFVEVNEAYSVLGKMESRLRYDESLYSPPKVESRAYGSSPYVRTYEYYNYAKHKGNGAGAIYFTRSKLQLFCFCCVLIIIGTGIQLKALHNQRYVHSHRIAISLKKARERGVKMNEEYTEKFTNTSK